MIKENNLEIKKSAETINAPDLTISHDNNEIWHTILLQSASGEIKGNSEIANNVREYFISHPVDLVISQQVTELLNQAGDEVLFWFSYIQGYPEIKDKVFDYIKKHKPINNPEELLEQYIDLIDYFKKQNHELENGINQWIVADVDRRREIIPDIEEKYEEVISYFRPKITTTPEREVVFLPSDPFLSDQEGNGVPLGDKIIMLSNVENQPNQVHEFLHSIINPITEKVIFTPEQEQLILSLAPEELVDRQGYGKHVKSLINESIIRVFGLITEGTKPQTLESFSRAVEGIDEENFKKIIQNHQPKFAELGIKTLADFKEKKDQYFKKFTEDILAQKAYSFFMKYEEARATNHNLNFEDFFIDNYDLLFD